MHLYVYQNWRVESKPRATIHFATFSFCNNGKGIHPNADTSNGRWHGPFGTVEQARLPMEDRGVRVRCCGRCQPC